MVINFKSGDLFGCDANVSLAHCVSADFVMGKGIALQFKHRFGRIDKLLVQGVQVGGCASLVLPLRTVYYLVTKKRYFLKPTYDDLTKSLCKMRDQMIAANITQLAMPRIGCGLDGLSWVRVEQIINQVFLDSKITIDIYSGM